MPCQGQQVVGEVSLPRRPSSPRIGVCNRAARRGGRGGTPQAVCTPLGVGSGGGRTIRDHGRGRKGEMREGDIKRGAVFQGRSKRGNWGVGCGFRAGSARREAGGVSIPRWCGVGHCRSRGRVLAVSWVGREPLPHVPTSGLRVGGGVGGGGRLSCRGVGGTVPAAGGVGGAEGAGGRQGHGLLQLRDVCC